MRMHEKAKGIIKCFLIMNDGKWFNSSEIATFLATHNFGLGNYYISPHSIGRIVVNGEGIFNDIRIRKNKKTNRKEYSYDSRASN